MKEDLKMVSSGGVPLSGVCRLPERLPSGVVVIVHGLADHAGRFEHVATHFNRTGMAVVCFDLRGHGNSQGKRGHFPSYAELIEDIERFIAVARERVPGVPAFLYGQSMGGNLVINFGIRCQPAISGIIASSPWLRLAHPPSRLMRTFAAIMATVYPGFTSPNRLNPLELSHDRAVADAYANDPLVHGLISARTFSLINDAGEFAIEHAGETRVPLLLMHGTADRITSIQASRAFFEKLAGRSDQGSHPLAAPSPALQHQFIAWPGLYHELHNEPEQETVLQAVSDWISRIT
jgi:alpha-beta hydrolase superfamily lysophospholipase